MAGSPGPVARRVAENLRRVRQERGLSYAELARRLEGTGHPIRDTGLLKIEKGDRGVGVDDLAALAVALGTTPNRLLLPDMGRGAPDDGQIAPGVKHSAGRLWAWASGEAPLGRSPASPSDDPENRGEEFVFSRENRQHLWNAPAPAAPSSRAEAASRVFAVTGITALIQEAFIAGLSTTDIRATVEGAIMAALLIPDPAKASARIEIADGRVTVRTCPPGESSPGPPEAMEEQ
jgi:transcriptional regulator with XRE-family HTH domain